MASRPPTPTREEFFLHGIERVPTDSTDDTAPGATECAICLNAYDDEVPVRIIQCGHIFGQQCLSSILDNSCTMCRAQLFHEGDPYDPDDDLPTTEAHDRFHEALAIISETTDRHNYEEDPRVYARTRFEASAAAATAGRSRLYDRTLYGHTVRFRLPRIPRAPGVAPPTGDSAARDPRPYETVPVLEEIHERDFLRATPPPLCPHVRVSVRPAAIWFNFFSYFRAVRALRVDPGRPSRTRLRSSRPCLMGRCWSGAWSARESCAKWRSCMRAGRGLRGRFQGGSGRGREMLCMSWGFRMIRSSSYCWQLNSCSSGAGSGSWRSLAALFMKS